MADVTKIMLGLFLIGFWLFLPLGMGLMGVGGVDIVDTPEVSNNALTVFGNGISMYFQLLVFDIPNVNVYLRYFINFLQLATILFIVLMFKE